jgi:phage terminase large subunit-like protein
VAWKWDTTAAVPLWFRDEKYRLFGPAEVLIPPRDGNTLDPAKIEAALIRIHERNPITTIVMDMSRAEQLASWATTEFGCTVIDWPQTIPAAIDEYDRFMEALRMGWLKHQGDADLTSHTLNAVARILPRGDAVFERPSQSRRSNVEQAHRVIDALKAASMVHAHVTVPIEQEDEFAWA